MSAPVITGIDEDAAVTSLRHKDLLGISDLSAAEISLVLDTADSTITGKGEIDLGAETMALEFLAHPKDASVLTASTPVRIEGTFKKPEIRVVSEELQEKSLAALALGVILPVLGAALPFIEEGGAEDANCGRLIEDALASVERASPAPPPD